MCLRGKENTNGLGATVRLETASSRLHVRQITPATGFLSSNEPKVIIGLGDEHQIKSLSVEWPGSVRSSRRTAPSSSFKNQQSLFANR